MREVLKSIKNFFTKENFYFFILLQFFLILSSLLEIIGIGLIPIYISLIIDPTILKDYIPISYYNYYLQGKDLNEIVFYGALTILIVFIFKNTFLIFIEYFQGQVLKKIRFNTSIKIFNTFLSRKYEFFLNTSKSLILRILIADVSKSISFYTELIRFSKEIFLGLFTFIFIFLINKVIALIILSSLSIFIIIYFFYIKKKINILGNEVNILLGEQYKIINESIESIKEVFISNKQANISKIFKEKVFKVEKNFFLNNFIQSLPKFFLEVLAISSILIISVIIVFSSKNINLIIPIMSLAAVATIRLIPSFNSLSKSISMMIYLYPAFKNITEILAEKNIEKKDLDKVENNNNNFKQLRFDKVYFSYEKNNNVLHNINFTINRGEKFGIYGMSGAGKSTILDLMVGLIKPQRGEVLVNHENLKDDKNLKNWRKLIGYAPQSSCFIDDTLEKNISFFENEELLNKEKIDKAIKYANLDYFLENSINGKKILLGDRGLKVSGGERQRISIARALYSDPELLILDETTSALDLETENKILNELEKEFKEKTIIIISHKPKTLRICDKIIILENNTIKEIATREIFLNNYIK